MKMRPLQKKDAEFMLEWMHDDVVIHNLKTDFKKKTIEDCYKFIEYSYNSKEDIHMAVVDDNDEYMGTVSLKHIYEETAEFAITFRSVSFGKGYSIFGMHEILNYGKKNIGLEAIYWCVSPNNDRAVRFYDKNGFERVNLATDDISVVIDRLNFYTQDERNSMYWYKFV